MFPFNMAFHYTLDLCQGYFINHVRSYPMQNALESIAFFSDSHKWKNEEFLNWSILSKITKELFSQATLTEYGSPKCFSISPLGLFCFGMSKGSILIYDSSQIFITVLRNEGNSSAISSLSATVDYVASAHEDGEFVIWTYDNWSVATKYSIGCRIIQIDFVSSSELLCCGEDGNIVLFSVKESSFGFTQIPESFQICVREKGLAMVDFCPKNHLISISTDTKVQFQLISLVYCPSHSTIQSPLAVSLHLPYFIQLEFLFAHCKVDCYY